MFFTGLSELMQEGQIVNLTLLKKGERLHVSVMPKVRDMPEAAVKKLIPLNVNGTPSELDQGFLEAVSRPVQERFGLITNADAFRENTKAAASRKAPATAATASKDTKLTKNERMAADAEAHEKAGRWPEAYQIYKKASAADPANEKLKEKVMEVWGKMAQRPLFGTGEDEVQPGPSVATTVKPSPEDSDEGDDEIEYGDEEERDEDEYMHAEASVSPSAPAAPPVEDTDTSSRTGETPPADMFAQLLGMASKLS